MPKALVTGVSSGIGSAIALSLLGAGYQVTGLSRRKPDYADEFAENFLWVPADLGDIRAVAQLALKLEPPEVFIHAAGFMSTGALGEMESASLAEMFAVHVQAPAELVNVFARSFPDGARVILIGSRTMSGVAGKSQYSATKSALAGLSRSWAMELAGRGITCNVVAPGPTDTPMMIDPRRRGVPPVTPPLGSLVDPHDVAALVRFLIGEHGKSITGQVLTICGGASLKS
ncbi:3-oxoacyl-ACP reductase [Arthrobacter sp. MYb229]|uniref:SDR family NAD(P)-dependent oxidoreductase n=1 Tax=unclassified Arthrobacter TaxID=235627 RepID=UPI000CFB0F47|nr:MULTISPECIES: SDR family oxidoreductase [unclassified Arthrobacter]PRA04416.1 3-oxoacyl-ACP reductase [Arthrobacter sp. MYb229]PRB51670.1 3-oxoacyl-ACP reductase [Arthrobacter sp. MYb216]